MFPCLREISSRKLASQEWILHVSRMGKAGSITRAAGHTTLTNRASGELRLGDYTARPGFGCGARKTLRGTGRIARHGRSVRGSLALHGSRGPIEFLSAAVSPRGVHFPGRHGHVFCPFGISDWRNPSENDQVAELLPDVLSAPVSPDHS